jgi:HAAS domain-containing protein
MSNGLDHRLVRDYLAELDRALATVPAAEAAELREQITTHLDDALPPDADDEQVAGVLTRLGRPSDLASVPPGPSAAELAARRARRRQGRITWAIVGLVVLAVAAWPTYVGAMHSVAALQPRGAAAWWYPQDTAHQVRTEADGLVQLTVPIRSAERQGFVVDVYNPSGMTQTVLGATQTAYGATEDGAPGSPYSQLAVSTREVRGGAAALRAGAYGLPGVIPPHQSRAIRLMWVSIECDERGGGGSVGQLVLQVRVGLITRTETLTLNQTWAVVGPSTGKYALTAPACK